MLRRTFRAVVILWALLVAALSVPVTAHAQCPPGAQHGGSIGSYDKIKIVGLSSSDAYYSDAAKLIGNTGRIEGAFSTGDCWFAGQYYGDNGDSYYFYQVAVIATGGSSAPAAGGCPGGAYTGAVPTSGTRIKVLTVSPDDAYYSSRASYGLEGATGRTDGAWSSTGSCWYAGQFYTDAGDSYYFYQAAIQVLGGSAPVATGGSCPAGSYTGTPPSSGSRITVLTVSPEDAYYSSRTSYGLEGRAGKTDGSWMKTGEPCWFAGQFYADNGDSYYFYQAAISFGGGSVAETPGVCPAGATTRGSIPGGSRVTLIGLHPDDAYYSSRGTMIGVSGKVDGDLHSNDGCWMGGGFYADDGTYYYFYKGAFSEGGGSAVSSGGAVPTGIRYMGGSIADGARFQIVALHPDDAYYPDRATLKGKRCKAVGNMPGQGKGWYSGQARCDDGTEPYFYKVGVSLE